MRVLEILASKLNACISSLHFGRKFLFFGGNACVEVCSGAKNNNI